MYYHKPVFSKGCRLETTEQQACHATLAKKALENLINRKERKGRVKYV